MNVCQLVTPPSGQIIMNVGESRRSRWWVTGVRCDLVVCVGGVDIH